MWKLTIEAKDMEPLPGIPFEDIDDERFAEYAAGYDAQFEPGALAASRFWEHVADSKKAKPDAPADGDK